MKILIGMIVMMVSFGVLADHSVTHDVEQSVERGTNKDEDFDYCRTKAALAQDVHQNRETLTLKSRIVEILEAAERPYEGELLPWSVVLEMQRVTRDAYRFRGTTEEYSTEVFETCAVEGF